MEKTMKIAKTSKKLTLTKRTLKNLKVKSGIKAGRTVVTNTCLDSGCHTGSY
jgi:hypothetical protein